MVFARPTPWPTTIHLIMNPVSPADKFSILFIAIRTFVNVFGFLGVPRATIFGAILLSGQVAILIWASPIGLAIRAKMIVVCFQLLSPLLSFVEA